MLFNPLHRWLQSIRTTPARSRKRSVRWQENKAAAVECLEQRAMLSANSAPVLTGGSIVLSTITEDQSTNGGYLVGDLVQGRVTDADAGAVTGIALTGTTNGNGRWQFSTDSGGTWHQVEAVSPSASLLLRSNDLIRFSPNLQDGTTASITFRAWDQTSGIVGNKVDTTTNGGTTAFSEAQVTGNLNVTAMNDSPELTGANNFTSIFTTDVNNAGQPVSTLIAGRITDVDPSPAQGIAIINFVVGTGGWQYSLNDGGTWNNIDTVFRSSALLLRPTDRLRYVPYGTEPTTASLTFLAWDQTSGTAGTRYNATAPGGGGRTYSLSEATSQISVTSEANDAPIVTGGSFDLPGLIEEEVNNRGYPVSYLLDGRVTDGDVGALSGLALTGTVNGNGKWQYSTNGGSSWVDVGPVSQTSALLLRSNDFLRFVPNQKNGTTASITFRAWDQTSGTFATKVNVSTNGSTTAFSAEQLTANLTVWSMNDSPVLNGANNFAPITTNDTNNAGQLVSTLIAGKITDVDEGSLQGIAIIDFQVGTGGWQYSLNNGSTWSNIETVFRSSALLLRSTDRVRYVPYGNDPTTASLTFLAWDQTSGAAGTRFNATITGGGSRTYSSAQATSQITVTSANHAPVLTSGNINVSQITEDQTTNGGYLVGDMVLSRVTDSDAGALFGIAVTGTTSGNGTWQYSINGGSSWTNVGAVTSTSSLLLRSTDLVRFVPDAKNGTAASLTFRAWDRTSGDAGNKVNTSTNGGLTAFSEGQVTANLIVTSVNDAPVLNGANNFANITEDQLTNSGNAVSALIAGKITDVDAGALQGIALTGLNNSNGKWQYSTTGGSSWTDVGSVSVDSALLLKPTDRLRYIPNKNNGTTASVTFKAWDQSTGTAGTKVNTTNSGGTRAFSIQTAIATVTVESVNDAPLLSGANNFSNITEDELSNSGKPVGSLIAGKIADVDAGAAIGIAVVNLNSGNGRWQYSINEGQTWANVETVSTQQALLLRSADRLRFIPNGQNATSASVSFLAWDQTIGSAGTKVNITATGATTAFSVAQATANITVTAVNDAPVLTGANNFANISRIQVLNTGSEVSALIDGKVTDIDTGSLRGIAVVGLSSGNGLWQYSTDQGANWTNVGTVSSTSALLLKSTDRLRFVPNPLAATTASVTFRAWDQSTGTAGSKVNVTATGLTTAFSNATATSQQIVT